MYPANYFNLFPPFPRDDTVFVAMSFDPRFQQRWTNVIERAIQGVSVNGSALRPIRVDARVVGDSILTEILSGIGRARVILADVTSIGTKNRKPIRNGNVMYEVGLAHATRLPEEVLLFRSDKDPLLFDTANVRVNPYRPDEDPAGARGQVGEAIVSAVREVDLRRNLAVQQVADILDAPCLQLLTQCRAEGQLGHPPTRTMAQAMSAVSKASAIEKLFALGLLKVRYKSLTADDLATMGDAGWDAVMPYVTTHFGEAVFNEVTRRLFESVPPEQLESFFSDAGS